MAKTVEDATNEVLAKIKAFHVIFSEADYERLLEDVSTAVSNELSDLLGVEEGEESIDLDSDENDEGFSDED